MSPDQISRRRMLKRIGAGAAIAWSAPVLSSLRTPAFAQYPGPVLCPTGAACFAVCGISVGPPGIGGTPCNCRDDTEGNRRCGNNYFCFHSTACINSAECVGRYGAGFFCQNPTCAGFCGQVCAPECGRYFPTPRQAREAGQKDAG